MPQAEMKRSQSERDFYFHAFNIKAIGNNSFQIEQKYTHFLRIYHPASTKKEGDLYFETVINKMKGRRAGEEVRF